MIPAVIGWVLPLVLVFSCGWVAASAWQGSGAAAARSRRRLLAALLETAFVALALRLVVEWSPVTIWLGSSPSQHWPRVWPEPSFAGIRCQGLPLLHPLRPPLPRQTQRAQQARLPRRQHPRAVGTAISPRSRGQ